MKCTLDEIQQKQLFKVVYLDLLNHPAETPFDLKAYIKTFYKEVKDKTNDDALALNYAQLLPLYIQNNVYVPAIADKLESNFAELNQTRKKFEDIDNVSKLINPEEGVAEKIEEIEQGLVQDKLDPVTSQEVKEPIEAEQTTIEPPETFLMSDWGYESWKGDKAIYPKEAFHAEVKRKILDAHFLNPNEPVELPGIGRVYLTAVSDSRIKDEHFKGDKRGEDGVVVVVTDSKGDFIYFDEAFGKTVPDKGKPAYYNIYKATGDYKLRQIKMLAIRRDISETIASGIVERETEKVAEIRKYINENPKEHQIRFNIKGGERGEIIDKTVKTPLTGVLLPTFNPEVDNVKGEPSSGRAFYRGDRNQKILLDAPKFYDKSFGNLAERLASLLFDDIKDSEGNVVLAPAKINLAKKYITTGTSKISLEPSRDNKTVLMSFPTLDKVPTDRGGMKQLLVDYLTKPKLGRPINKDQIGTRTIVSDKAKYKENYVTEVNGQHYILDTVNVNAPVNTLIMKEFEIVDGVLKKTDKNFKDYIKEHWYLPAKVDAQGRPRTLGAYLLFESTPTELSKLTEQVPPKQIIDKAVELANEKGKERAEKSEEELTPDEKYVAGKALAKKRKIQKEEGTEGLNKLLSQKVMDTKATPEQIAEAKVWYDNHPMSKVLGFKKAFEMVNTAANWTKDGITLFQGGDYSDLYHEAWHGFSQLFLTKGEKKSLYAEVGKKTGTFKDYNGNKVKFSNAKERQLEEYLAEDFRTYVLTKGKTMNGSPVRNSLFRRILNFLKALFTGTTISEIITDKKANKTIKDLYDKLWVGDINELSFSQENRNYDVLNKGIESIDKGELEETLGYEKSQEVVESIDSAFSEYIDGINSGLTEEQMLARAYLDVESNKADIDKLNALRGALTHKNSVSLLKTADGLTAMYKYAGRRFDQMQRKIMAAEEASDNPFEKTQYGKILDTLQYVLNNFGDELKPSNNEKNKGVIGYHIHKSKLISKETRQDIINDELDNVAETGGKTVYDRGGNESSVADLAEEDTETILRTLFDRDGKGNNIINTLGFQKLAPYGVSINRIMMAVENSISPQEMYKKLKEQENNYHPIKQLLEKLGPVSYEGQTEAEVDNWTAFYQTFNLYKIKMRQGTIDIVSKDENGNPVTPYVKFTIGDAFGDYKRVGDFWNDGIALANPGENGNYIANSGGKNYLDLVKLTEKYPNADSIEGKEFEFLRDIGVVLRDDGLMRGELTEAINKGDIKVSRFPQRLQKFKEAGYSIDSVGLFMGAHDKLKLPSETTNYNALMQLQTKYSGEWSNGSSKDAEGNLIYERSLNTTLTKLVNYVNSAKTFAELVAIPAMSHLAITSSGIAVNPLSKNSVWLNSIFDMKTGLKREGAVLTIENLSGIALLNNGKSTDTGTATATADEYTKLIADFHLMLMTGTPENARAADKKTSLTTFVNDIVTYDDKQQKYLYVDTIDFLDTKTGVILGRKRGFEIVFPYLKSEMERVATCKQMLAKGSMVEEYDFEYLNRGKEIVMFDYLSKGIQDKLHAITGSVDKFFETPEGIALKGEIEPEVTKYFSELAKEFSDKFSEAEFVSKELLNQTRAAGIKNSFHIDSLSDVELRNAAVRSFVYNSWIHGVEQSLVLFGDIALYKDFNKRIPGFNSTGKLLRTDGDWYDFINKNVGFGLAKLKGIEQPAYDGKIHTAVFSDIILQSAYIKEYTEVLGVDAKKYEEINEGDAQGWISFDMYRIVCKSLNEWSKEQESAYQRIIKGDSLFDVKEFFPVKKMSYSGPLANEGLPLSAYHKFALFPLIPSVIKGTKLEELHEKMMRENIGYALFESGSKVSTITNKGQKDKLYDQAEPFTKNTVYAEFLKDQIKVSTKFKEEITFISQMRKLADTGLMENGIPTDYKGTKEEWDELAEADKMKSSNYNLHKTLVNHIHALSNNKEQGLLNDMGWKRGKDGQPTGDVKKLVEFVLRELETKDIGEHELGFLQIGPDGQLKNDLSLSLSTEQIQKLIIALLNKRLLKYKVNGEQFTQVSGAGFQKATQEENEKFGTNDLPTYHKGENGLTQAAKCKIAIQGDFKKLLRTPRVQEEMSAFDLTPLQALNKLIKTKEWLKNNRDMITMSGARIPTQGLNSMEFVEVWEFLPEEAGNIIILPAEITVKSGTDYDFDKIPMMMPNLQMLNGVLGLHTDKQSRVIYDKIKKEKIALNELRDAEGNVQKYDPAVDKLITAIFGQTDYTQDEINDILKEENLGTYEEFIANLNGSKVIENEIIQSFRRILEKPENLKYLIKPNDTSIAEPLAKEMENISGAKKYKKGSGSHLFSFLYNLRVHQVNSVGKKALGIAAIANVYNSILNAVGGHLNPSYKIGKAKQEYRNKILLPHNTIKVNGQEVISLSNLTAKDGNYIPEVISQLMNGLVDIAKDPWIFHLQANQELVPSLLFMVQAGVPLKTAVYLLSQPLVMEYVKEQQLNKSTFAPALGRKSSKMKAKKDALRTVLDRYGIPVASDKNSDIYQTTLNYTDNYGVEAFKDENLLLTITHQKTGDRYKPTDEDVAAFLHYVEIENMAKALTDLQTKSNLDTSTSQDAIELNEQIGEFEGLKDENRFPASLVTKVEKETSIGAFYKQPLISAVMSTLVQLNNHPVLKDFLSTITFDKQLNESFKDKSDFDAAFTQDLVNYIFQNTVRAFDMDATEYKGGKVSTKPVKEVTLEFGAFVKNDVLYVDKKQLEKDFVGSIYSTDEYQKRGLAKVNENAFTLQKEYNHFVYERESLRAMYPYKEVQDNYYYKQRLEANTKTEYHKKEGDSQEVFIEKMKRRSYEEFLKDKALDNIYNPWAMFKSGNSYAKQFADIKKDYPELTQKYSLVKNLLVDTKIGYNNLKLNTNKLDKALIEIYNENLRELSKASIMKVEDVVENERISNFFAKFPLYAFMQSGMNTKSLLSLGRIAPQGSFIATMAEPQKDWMEKMSPEILEDYLGKFITENLNRGTRVRGKDYLSDSTITKVVKPVDKVEEKVKEVVQEELPKIEQPIQPQDITDEEVRERLKQCFNL